MNDIINLEKATEYVVYNPILTLSEDVDYDIASVYYKQIVAILHFRIMIWELLLLM